MLMTNPVSYLYKNLTFAIAVIKHDLPVVTDVLPQLLSTRTLDGLITFADIAPSHKENEHTKSLIAVTQTKNPYFLHNSLPFFSLAWNKVKDRFGGHN